MLSVCEVILQLLDKPATPTMGWTYQGIRSSEVNEAGFRGQPIRYNDDDTIVVLLGDSQVEADGLEASQMPEKALQDVLGKHYKVFTIGASGYGNDQQLLALQDYFKQYRADYVVLWQTFDNDVWNNMFPTHQPRNGMPKPTYILQNGNLQGPVVPLEDSSFLDHLKLVALLKRVINADGPDEYWEQYLPSPYQPSYLYTGKAEKLLDPEHGGNPNENFINEKNHYAVRFFPISDRTEYGLKLTNALLHEIARESKEHNADFLLFNVDLKDFNPDYSQDTTVYRIGNDFYFGSLSERRKNMRKANKGIDWFSIGIYRDDWSISATDPHLNAKTNKDVMLQLADSLRSRF